MKSPRSLRPKDTSNPGVTGRVLNSSSSVRNPSNSAIQLVSSAPSPVRHRGGEGTTSQSTPLPPCRTASLAACHPAHRAHPHPTVFSLRFTRLSPSASASPALSTIPLCRRGVTSRRRRAAPARPWRVQEKKTMKPPQNRDGGGALGRRAFASLLAAAVFALALLCLFYGTAFGPTLRGRRPHLPLRLRLRARTETLPADLALSSLPVRSLASHFLYMLIE